MSIAIQEGPRYLPEVHIPPRFLEALSPTAHHVRELMNVVAAKIKNWLTAIETRKEKPPPIDSFHPFADEFMKMNGFQPGTLTFKQLQDASNFTEFSAIPAILFKEEHTDEEVRRRVLAY